MSIQLIEVCPNLPPFLNEKIPLAMTLTAPRETKESVKEAAKIVALKLRALYPDKEPWFVAGEFGLIQTPDGRNDKGYYWWEAGAAMGVIQT